MPSRKDAGFACPSSHRVRAERQIVGPRAPGAQGGMFPGVRVPPRGFLEEVGYRSAAVEGVHPGKKPPKTGSFKDPEATGCSQQKHAKQMHSQERIW